MNKKQAAVLGCTGLVGREFIRLLDGHPFFELNALFASPRSAGKTLREHMVLPAGCSISAATLDRTIEKMPVPELMAARGIEIVFSALPAAAAGPIELELRELGIHVFTNAGANRMAADIPILIPEINPKHLELARIQKKDRGGCIVANSNCVTAGFALSLKPLTDLPVNRVFLTTYQAVSGAGRHGTSGFDMNGNVIPHIAEEEQKIVRETKKILGSLSDSAVIPASFDIFASCARVPVKFGHLLSVCAELAEPVEHPQIENRFRNFRGLCNWEKLPTAPEFPLVLADRCDRPQPALDSDAGNSAQTRGMSVTLGRLRCTDKYVSYFALVHNLIRGAAGAAVLNAEYALHAGLLNPSRENGVQT